MIARAQALHANNARSIFADGVEVCAFVVRPDRYPADLEDSIMAAIKNIEINVGEIDRISFASNAGSTGYLWVLTELPNNLYMLDIEDVAPQHPVPGKAGTRVFTILGARPGRGRLSFTLVRPWEPDHPIQRAVYNVVVHQEPVIRPLYGVAIQDAIAGGDLPTMQRLAVEAEAQLHDHQGLATALAKLKAEIARLATTP